jgi:hypothetical protein
LTRLRPAPKLSLPLIKDPTSRARSRSFGNSANSSSSTYGFKLGWKFSLLEPMDLVTLTDVGTGLDFTPVRITEVVELEDGRGFSSRRKTGRSASASATLYPSEDNDGHNPENNIDPGDTTTPVIFNGPLHLSNNALELWIAPTGGQYWGGCEIWVSTDLGVTYRRVGTTNEKATYGELATTLDTGDAYPLVDEVNAPQVTVAPPNGSVALEDFNALATLCWCDGEFLAYKDSPSSLGNYELSTLYRGVYDSTIQASVARDAVRLLRGSGIFRLPFQAGAGGQTLYFKFPAFNIYGNALQSLADAAAVPFVITGDTPTGGTITSISCTGTVSPCDGTGSTDVSWTTSGMPGGESYTVFIVITSGAYTGQFRMYDAFSGDTLDSPFCPGESFSVTVSAYVAGVKIAEATDTFTS